MKSNAKKNFSKPSISKTSSFNKSRNPILSQVKTFWNYIWNGDSFLSWILAVLVIFILVRFIIYPLIGLLVGTSLPLVAVISGSMQHQGDFNDWWSSNALCNNDQLCTQENWYAQYNITKDTFESFVLKNGFNKGDLILLRGKKSENIVVGDILVFSSNAPYPIIHRVINQSTINDDEFIFETKGDANSHQISNPYLDEKKVHSSQALGVAYAKIPYLGYLKLWLVDGLSSLSQMSTTN